MQKCNPKKWLQNTSQFQTLRIKLKVFRCYSNLYTLPFISSLFFWRFLHVLGNSLRTSSLPFFIPFNWCGIVLAFKSIINWTFDSPTWLEFTIYANLCYNEVKIYILIWNLLCITHALRFAFFKGQTPKFFFQQRLLMNKMLTLISCIT